MTFEPLDGGGQPGAKVRRRLPAEALPRARGFESPPGLAVRLGRIEADLATEAGCLGDQRGQLGDADLAPAAEVDRVGVVVALHGGDDALGAIGHVQELARWCACTP